MNTVKRHLPAACRTAAVILCLLTAAPAWCADGLDQKRHNDDIQTLAGELGCKDKATRTAALARLRQKGQSAMSGLMNIPDDAPVSSRRGAIIGMASLPLAELGTNRYISPSLMRIRLYAALPHTHWPLSVNRPPRTAALLGSSNSKVRGAAAYALKLMGKQHPRTDRHSLKRRHVRPFKSGMASGPHGTRGTPRSSGAHCSP